jgi:hypothetical protein
MGSENSKTQKISNNDVMENINKLFGSLSIPTTITETSLHMDDYSGGEYPTRQRYKEFEYQLGGELKKVRLNNKLQNFSNLMYGGDGDYDSDLEFDNDDNDDNDDNNDYIDDVRDDEIDEHDDMEHDDVEHEEDMIGGGLSETSKANMTEIRNMKTNALSPTSGENVQDGGADTLSSLSGFLTDKNTTSQVFNSEINKMRGGGAETSLSSLAGMTSMMSGGRKQSSEEINVMPFYSSTSGSDYYSEMQKENRYT